MLHPLCLWRFIIVWGEQPYYQCCCMSSSLCISPLMGVLLLVRRLKLCGGLWSWEWEDGLQKYRVMSHIRCVWYYSALSPQEAGVIPVLCRVCHVSDSNVLLSAPLDLQYRTAYTYIVTVQYGLKGSWSLCPGVFNFLIVTVTLLGWKMANIKNKHSSGSPLMPPCKRKKPPKDTQHIHET